jgi:CelD/BcsL family acetyltransferase involved in cellulose biosynthesis
VNARTFELGPRFVSLAPTLTTEGAVSLEILHDVASFARLRGEWNQLVASSRSSNVFLTWEWLHTWWTHLHGDRRLAILVVRRGTDLVGIAPLASTRTGLLGAPKLEFLGTGRVGSDYLDVIVRQGFEDEVIPSLGLALVRKGLALDMKQVRITKSAASQLARELRRSGCSVWLTRTHLCRVIDLRGRSFETYLGSLGSEHRYNFHRRLRQAEAQHSLRFECVSSEERRRVLLPVLFELHRLRWSARGGSDGLEGPGIRAFHEDLTALALERGWLRLFVLWFGDSPAAAVYGFRYGQVFSFYQSGFDPKYRKLSVGLLAMGLAIKSAIEEGALEFDLLHGDEAYKSHWARKTRRLGRFVAFPMGPLGRLSRRAAEAGYAGRGFLRKLSRGVAAHIAAGRGGSHAAPPR